MKKYILVLLCASVFTTADAQLMDRLRSKVEQKINQKIEDTFDKATQKKEGTDKTSSTNPNNTPSKEQEIEPDRPNTHPAEGSTPVSAQVIKAEQSPIQNINAYSKFDFIAGDKVIMEENFSNGSLGDFPSQWNTRSGAEIVKIVNREEMWLRMGQNGVFYPEYINEALPENFTLQMDVLANQHVANISHLMISFLQAENTDEIFNISKLNASSRTDNFKISLQPSYPGEGKLQYSTNLIGNQYRSGVPEFNVPDKPAVKISIWRQKQRVRVYLDSTKILDLPRAFAPNASFNTLSFSVYEPAYDHQEGAYFINNIRLAVGLPNLRERLSADGKFSTNGILFDVNSDQIKPQSYGSLQDIANLLKEDSSLRLNIIGHTDGDGNDAANLELSKRRAQSVLSTLSTSFGIDATRHTSDGKGKTEPIDSNTTATGKANNRRVEFVKL